MSPKKDHRTVIDVILVPELHEKSKTLMGALDRSGLVFVKDGIVVQLTTVDGKVTSSIATRDSLRHLASEYARFVKHQQDRRSGETKVLEIHPPQDVVLDLLSMGNWEFPILEGIVRHPIVTPEGEIVSVSGYHRGTKLYLDLDPELEGMTVSDLPSPRQMEAAVTALKEIMVDFPFDTESDRTAAIGLFLTVQLRSAFRGNVPLFLISAPAPGTGKTLLIQMLILAILGQKPPLLSEVRDADEFLKTLVALLQKSPEVIVLDNIAGRVESGTLANVVTAGQFQGRVLGVSRMVEVTIRSVFCLTGNNTSLSNELTRRTVPIRMVPTMEQPWRRTGFRHEDLEEFVLTNRANLIRAGLTLARAWFAAGRPKPASKPLGSLEAWHRTVGGILETAGLNGFLDNLKGFQDVADTETATWSTFVRSWKEIHDVRQIKSSELLEIALKAEIIEEGKTPRATMITLGKALAKMVDRTFGQYQIKRGDVVTGYQFWKLVESRECVNVVNVSPPTQGKEFIPSVKLPEPHSLHPLHSPNQDEGGESDVLDDIVI